MFAFFKARKELQEVKKAEKSLHVPLEDSFRKLRGARRKRFLEGVRHYNKSHAEYLEALRKENDKAERTDKD